MDEENYMAKVLWFTMVFKSLSWSAYMPLVFIDTSANESFNARSKMTTQYQLSRNKGLQIGVLIRLLDLMDNEDSANILALDIIQYHSKPAFKKNIRNSRKRKHTEVIDVDSDTVSSSQLKRARSRK